MNPPPRLARICGCAGTTTTMRGGGAMTWPGGAIEIGCANAAVPANKPTINSGTIERCID